MIHPFLMACNRQLTKPLIPTTRTMPLGSNTFAPFAHHTVAPVRAAFLLTRQNRLVTQKSGALSFGRPQSCVRCDYCLDNRSYRHQFLSDTTSKRIFLKCLSRHDIDRSPQEGLKLGLQLGQPKERGTRSEVNQEVDVAVGRFLPAGARTEDCDRTASMASRQSTHLLALFAHSVQHIHRHRLYQKCACRDGRYR